MAARAGIAVPTSSLLVDDEGNQHLLIERFDVNREGRRLHAHTLSGLLHAEKAGLDYADLFRATSRLMCSREDLLQVARRMIFNVLAANHDDHGKNHSFLLDETSRTWRLSPAYDLTYSPGIARGMTVGGEVVPDARTMRRLCLSAGLSDAEADAALEQAREAIGAWPKIAADHGVRKDDSREIGKALRKLDLAVVGQPRSKRDPSPDPEEDGPVAS
jgi:serine/threonine-protein kinase HipA